MVCNASGESPRPGSQLGVENINLHAPFAERAHETAGRSRPAVSGVGVAFGDKRDFQACSDFQSLALARHWRPRLQAHFRVCLRCRIWRYVANEVSEKPADAQSDCGDALRKDVQWRTDKREDDASLTRVVA